MKKYIFLMSMLCAPAIMLGMGVKKLDEHLELIVDKAHALKLNDEQEDPSLDRLLDEKGFTDIDAFEIFVKNNPKASRFIRDKCKSYADGFQDSKNLTKSFSIRVGKIAVWGRCFDVWLPKKGDFDDEKGESKECFIDPNEFKVINEVIDALTVDNIAGFSSEGLIQQLDDADKCATFTRKQPRASDRLAKKIVAKAESFKKDQPDVMRELPELTFRKTFFGVGLFELGAILFGAPIGYYLAVNDNIKYCADISLLGACALAVGAKCITTGSESAQKIYNKNAKPRKNIQKMLSLARKLKPVEHYWWGTVTHYPARNK
ncbi:MAG: hypothetical protein WC707_03830 [Candidatus Babeliaceae bacterium]|jgi:hypothetical protein